MRAPTLQLDETILEAPREDDVDAYVAGEDDRVRASLMLGEPTRPEQALARIRLALELWAADRNDWRFAIRDASDRAFAGMAIARQAGNGGHTLEYWVAARHRGRGHATRAAQLVTRFAFCDRRIRSLRGEIVPPNPESEAVLRAVGFWKQPGTVPVRDPRTGEYRQALHYYLTRRGWLQAGRQRTTSAP